ncbi:hypothetical protein [Bacillus sp. V5-8f]|nr:hypothetical protein [Bacillus sp. V5-8f]
MEQKPFYYDGSAMPTHVKRNEENEKIRIKITPDMRKYICCNPYHISGEQ